MLVCQQCGYAMYRSSGGRSHRKLDYYRCIGSDGYRRLNGPLCTNRPVRQDYLDQIVWEQVIRLLEDGTLIQSEIDRRREVAQNTDPRRQRGQGLRREQARLENHMERLVSAYQEGLVTLAQLRQRMPDLQKRSQAVESELHSLEMAVVDETRYLKLAENLTGFRTKLRVRAQTLDVRERQQLLRLLVKEILVGADALTIRHSIRIPPSGPGSDGPGSDGPPSPDAGPSEPAMTLGYRLRMRSRYPALRGSLGSATGASNHVRISCRTDRSTTRARKRANS
jgi:site-specific DNA recombinase